MDRRRVAGALLALAVCIAGSDAAPTANNQTSLDVYDGSPEGCYYNFQHYGEGDRIMTNEPCLNCTCHNRMLMCYLRVCPFTKPIGQDCTVEKRADQCCPIVTCPDVPVDLLTSTSTTSPAEYGATGLGKLDKYGCSINGKYFPEGSKVPPTPNKPCEHCYCIRNMTTCVMQECTLHVDGCTPIYHKDVCCPVRYSCDHPEDEIPLLDDMTTTVRPTPGFLLTTTTLAPVTQMTQDCVHDDQIVPDGALIKTEKACEHCYCMKGDIVCVVQECGTPMENEGKNCTSIPPREGQCCPDTYICEGDEVTTEQPAEFTTQALVLDELTTVSPPRRVGVEGSGYRNEPDEPYTESPSLETESEGSGYEQSTEAIIDNTDVSTPEQESPEPGTEITQGSMLAITTTGRTPTLEEIEPTEPDKGLNTVPSGIFEEEESSKPTATEETVTEEEAKPTSPTTTIKANESEDRLPTSDISTSDFTHRYEESSSTTEPNFQKEDESSEVTESGPTDDKKSIQTTEHPEQLTTTTEDIVPLEPHPSVEDSDKATSSDDVQQKEITTESIIDISTHSEETKPSIEITTQSIESTKIDTFISTTEKIDIPETTSIDNKENEVEDTPRIPGEGDCLLNEITYRNNSDVPSTNKCQTSCKCISSIIKCDPIICSSPPEYMNDCQTTYDTPDSCCPTYVCHTGETMPPQPHSQMSGTESPALPPSVECEGDQCSLITDSPPLASSDKPNLEDCGSDCSQVPVQPPSTVEHVDCVGDKCLSPSDACAGDNCQVIPERQPCSGEKCSVEPEIVSSSQAPVQPPSTDEHVECVGADCEVTPEKQPCSGEKCSIEPEIVPVKDTPLCQNENDCTVQQQPQVPSCDGEACVNNVSADCGAAGCGAGDVSPPVSIDQGSETCAGDDCQKPQDETSQICEGDSCRRKETSDLGSYTPECSSTDCLEQKPVTETVDKKPETKPSEEERVTESVTDVLSTVEADLKSQAPLDQVPTEAPASQTTYNLVSEISTTKQDISTEEETTLSTLPKDKEPSTITTQPPEEESSTPEEEKIKEHVTSPQYSTSTQIPYEDDSLIPTKPEEEKEVLESTPSSLIPKEPSEHEDVPTTAPELSPADMEPTVPAETETPLKEPATFEATTLKQLDEPIQISTKLPQIPGQESEDVTTESLEYSPTVATSGMIEDTFTQEPEVPEVHKETDMQEETSTKSDKEDIGTEFPEILSTIQESTDEDKIKSTEKPQDIATLAASKEEETQTDLPAPQKTDDVIEPTTSVPEISGSSSISESDITHDVTTEPNVQSEEIGTSEKVTEAPYVITTQISNVDHTESDENREEATTASDESKSTESERVTSKADEEISQSVTESQKPKLDESGTATSEYESSEPLTNAPPIFSTEDKTNAPESSTTEGLLEISHTPDIYETPGFDNSDVDKQEDSSRSPVTGTTVAQELSTQEQHVETESPVIQVTEKQETSTLETLSDNEVEPEFTTVNVGSERETEAPTPLITVPLEEEPVTTMVEDNAPKSPEQPSEVEQGTEIPAPEVNEVLPPEDMPQKHTTEEEEHDKEISKPTPSPEFKETITTESDSSDNEVDENVTKPQLPEHATKLPDDSVTEKQESPETPAAGTYEESPTTEQVPAEPYIPVHAEPAEPPKPSEDESVTEIPDITTESPVLDTEISSKIPERQGQEDEDHTTIPLDIMPGSQEETTPETATQSPEIKLPEMEVSQSYEPPSETPVTEKEITEQSPQTTEPTIKTQDDISIGETTEPGKSTIAPEALTDRPDVTKIQESMAVPSEEEKEKESEMTDATEKPHVTTKQEEPLDEGKTTVRPEQYTIEPEKQDTTESLEVTPEKITTEQPEPIATESLPSLATETPESHIKETAQEEGTSEPQDKTTPAPQDIVTVMLEESPTEVPKETPLDVLQEIPSTETHEISSEAPQDEDSKLHEMVTTSLIHDEDVTRKPQDLTTGQVEITTSDITQEQITEKQQYDITPDTINEVATEEPYLKTTLVSTEPEQMSEQPPSEDTEHKEVSTEKPHKDITQLPDDVLSTIDTRREGVTDQPQEPATEKMQEGTTAASEEIMTDTPQLMDSKTPVLTDMANETPKPQEISTEAPQEAEPPLKVDTEIPHKEEVAQVTDTTKLETDSTEPSDIITLPPKEQTDSPKPGLVDDNISDIPVVTEQPFIPKEESHETTPYLVELEEHTHKPVDELSTIIPTEEESITLSSIPDSHKEDETTEVSSERTTAPPESEITDDKKSDVSTTTSSLPEKEEGSTVSEKEPVPTLSAEEEPVTPTLSSELAGGNRFGDEDDSSATTPKSEVQNVPAGTEDENVPDVEVPVQTEKASTTEKAIELEVSSEAIVPEDEVIPVTSKATTLKAEEESTTQIPSISDKKPEDKPSEALPSTPAPEIPKPGFSEMQPTDEVPDDESHFPPSGGSTGYGGQEPDYVEEDQAFGPGTCRYGGKVYVSAQQIPRDDPCDFCFCFRSDIICLQQSCPPPIHGCHEEPIQGFCCPRYECPVAMATTLNVTTTTTTTTTTLPPHFLPHAYKGAAQRRGCHIKGHTYKVGEVVRASSGPCLHCTCGGDGQMKCDPKACTPEPMLRQMIAAAVSAKRRR